jgi:hypothetical protein
MAANSAGRSQTPPLPSLGDWAVQITVAVLILIIVGTLTH